MRTFGDLYVGDKLFIINNNCTIDIYKIMHFKSIGHSVSICTALEKFILSANRTYERFNNIVICSNPITAKAVLEELLFKAMIESEEDEPFSLEEN